MGKNPGDSGLKKAINNTDTNLRAGLILASWAFKNLAPNCVLTDFGSLLDNNAQNDLEKYSPYALNHTEITFYSLRSVS